MIAGRRHRYFWSDDANQSRRERFSLLMLEPGEIYFEDFSVYYYSSEVSEQDAIERRQKGRLKICSKSVVFDPQDVTYPVLKFLFKNTSHIGKWRGPLLSKLDGKGELITVDSHLCIMIKEGNIIAPYKYVKKKTSFLFSLNYVPLSNVLPQIEQLMRASTLNPRDESSMVATIVQSKQGRMNFNTSWIEDLYERIVLETNAEKISPLICNPGKVLLTSARLYFQPFNNIDPTPVTKVKLTNIRQVIKRRYLLMSVGIEIFSCTDDENMYLILDSQQDRDDLYNHILDQDCVDLEDTKQANILLKWQAGAVSNLEYLLYLNSQGDRSFNDLTQYPVVPWVIADYTSEKLDLKNPNTFRDLSKPIGAIDPERIAQLRKRCKNMPEPKFLYGSHYSTPGFVLFYLVRVCPEYMLCLQNGKFDHADRLFSSISSTWMNCCSGHSDFKELIPEFYSSDGEFLLNSMNLSLGTKQDGSNVHNTELPPWADSPLDFVTKMREALECPYVSENLHHWIDLIFGYKQRGEEAWKADNVFYYLTYEGAVDLEGITCPNERASLRQQILEFGQTPRQLFTSPHPQRKVQIPSNILACLPTFEDEAVDTDDDSAPLVDLSDINSDGNVLIVVGESLWKDLELLKLSQDLRLHKEAVLGLSMSVDGGTIASVSQDTQVKLFSSADGQLIRSMNLSSMALSSCFLMPDSKSILVGSWDNNVYIYSVDYGRVVDTVNAHDDAVTIIRWSANTLLTASWDSTAKVWEFTPEEKGLKPASPVLLGELEHEVEVTAADLLVIDNSVNVVTGTQDGHVILWDIDNFIIERQSPCHSATVTSVAFSGDGQRLFSCSEDHWMKVMDISSGVEIYSKNIKEPIKCSCWDGQIVVLGLQNGTMLIWDLMQVGCTKQLRAHEGTINSICVSHDGKTVATAGSDSRIKVWTTEGG